MKKAFIRIASIITAVLLLIACTACTASPKAPQEGQNEAPTHVYCCLKLIRDYSSLQDLEDEAVLIVTGIRRAEVEQAFSSAGSDPVMTISAFEVENVLTEKGEPVSPGSVIHIMEYETYDRKNNIVYHDNDYTMMVEGERYLLFLKSGEYSGKQAYYPVGVNPGVVCLGENYMMTEQEWSGEHQDYRDRVNSIREEARQRYSEYLEP